MSSLLRSAFAACWLLLLATPVPAAPSRDPMRDAMPPRPPRFSLPESGVLFADDFSTDSLSGWTTERPDVWSVRRGVLRGDLPDRKQERSVIRAGLPGWTDYAVDLDVCLMRGVDKGLIVRVDGTDGIGIDMRGPGYQDVVVQQGFRQLGRASCINGNAIWHHLRVEARGHEYRVFVDGRPVLQVHTSRSSNPAGGIALPAYTGGVGECTVYYDNVVVTSLVPTPGAGAKEKP